MEESTKPTHQDDLTAAAVKLCEKVLSYSPDPEAMEAGDDKDFEAIMQALKHARQEALREAAKVCRANTYMNKDALDGGAFGGPGSCEYGCGDVIANELDRLASEGG